MRDILGTWDEVFLPMQFNINEPRRDRIRIIVDNKEDSAPAILVGFISKCFLVFQFNVASKLWKTYSRYYSGISVGATSILDTGDEVFLPMLQLQ